MSHLKDAIESLPQVRGALRFSLEEAEAMIREAVRKDAEDCPPVSPKPSE